jgi:hypothetical protein
VCLTKLSLLIEEITEELFKDTFWPDQVKALWHDRPAIDPVYDIENHENGECSCRCTPISRETVTRPTKEEIQAKPKRGRPKQYRREEKRGWGS